MAIAAIDIDQVIFQYLTATGTDLYGLVGTRVCPLRKRKDWADADKCLVFTPRGGDMDRDVPIKRPAVQFLCYGGSDQVQDAMAVAGALEDRLHGITMATVAAGVLLEAEQNVLPQPMVDPDTREVYVFLSYEMEIRGA